MLVLAATDIAFSQEKAPKTFTQSDTTYGDGGTVDRTFQGGSLTSQTYKDGEGHKKEVIEHKPDGGIVYSARSGPDYDIWLLNSKTFTSKFLLNK